MVQTGLALKRGVVPMHPATEDGDSEPFLGQYLLGGTEPLVPLQTTDVPCPYCHETMGLASNKDVAKVLWLGPVTGQRQEIGVQPLPPTHKLLWCEECRQAFTVLAALEQP